MKKRKITNGCVGLLVGCILFMLFMDSGRASNDPIALEPFGSFSTYFFGWVWSTGKIGWLLGSLVLILFLVLFYYIGIWLY